MKEKDLTPGQIIRKYRLLKGYSQKRFADLIPMSQSGLHRIESSKNIGT